MYRVLIKETNGAGAWSIDLEKVENHVKRKLQMTRTQIEIGLILMPKQDDKFVSLLTRVLHESNQNYFSMEITELHQTSKTDIFKNISFIPKADEPLVIVDFEGLIFSPVIYDAADQTWNYKGAELRPVIIHQWAYQSELYETFKLPTLSTEQKQSIRQKLEEEIKQEKDKKRELEKNLMEDLKKGLSKAFPDATIEINEIKLN